MSNVIRLPEKKKPKISASQIADTAYSIAQTRKPQVHVIDALLQELSPERQRVVAAAFVAWAMEHAE